MKNYLALMEVEILFSIALGLNPKAIEKRLERTAGITKLNKAQAIRFK